MLDDGEDRLATDLGRVGGDHRRESHLVEHGGDRRRGDAAGEQLVDACLEAALLGRSPGVAMEATTAFGVDVLGGVGEERQPTERADEVQLTVERRVAELCGQLGDRPLRLRVGR